MKITTNILIIAILIFAFVESSYSQIVAPTGVTSRQASQLIYYYVKVDTDDDADDFVVGGSTDNADSTIQITNTNDSQGVWIHVQMFRSYDADLDLEATTDDKIICEERDFIDFLTPNDTHVYDLEDDNFPRNIGETAATSGSPTSIVEVDSQGFIVITPIVSESDFSAISFQHLIGITSDDEEDFIINAMGRDAVDFSTGEIVPDGTPLDGTTSGFVVLQPEELHATIIGDTDSDEDPDDDANYIGIVFKDSYGPSGLLGYQVLQGDVTWTPFMFDFRENPTSCGNTPVNCFISVGINDTVTQDQNILSSNPSIPPGDLLCAGSETPNYDDDGATSFGDPDTFGWTRIFVSGLEDFENHIGLIQDLGNTISGAIYMYVKGEETEINPAENCAVAGDEDGDMVADCADPDCVGLAGPSGETCEAAEATCDDGFDNDGDGATDGADTDCDGSESCPTCESGDQCSDGEDNDGDGNSDCADGGCDGATGPNGETCEAGVELTCNDNQDNDGDGTADCDDPDCAIATNCVAGGGGGGGGCSVATTANPSMLNFLLPIIVVGLVIGIRRRYN